MSNHWEFYQTYISDNEASIFFDAEVTNEIEIAKFPYLNFIRISLQDPTEHGMVTQEENNHLYTLEDHLTDKLNDDKTLFVARITNAGNRDFIFYSSEEAGWEEKAQTAMTAFSDYQFTASTMDDAEWDNYFNLIYPVPREWEVIQNHKMLVRRIDDYADDLEAPREVDHFMSFENEEDGKQFTTKMQASGYKVIEHEKESADEPYKLQVLQHTAISLYFSLEIYDAVIEHNGDYDGWGATIIKKEA